MHIPGWLGHLIRRCKDRLFAAEDTTARARGWQVSRPTNGFGRLYRDPRWDMISECELCGGHGGNVAVPCSACEGHGTIQRTLSPSPRGDAL
ncbi:MAG: hypothetical protein LC799_14800 [Actinobacteria bacterium]|nr:hypothetical protein [Actinomycetota bacterium]